MTVPSQLLAQALTEDELKTMLLARYSEQEKWGAELNDRIQQEFGEEPEVESQDKTALRLRIKDFICSFLAKRLKANDRSIPIISHSDLKECISVLYREIKKLHDFEDLESDPDEARIFEEIMIKMLTPILDGMLTMLTPGEDSYEGWWKWILAVCDLAIKRGISPFELLEDDSAQDGITRRMFTQEQLTDHITRYLGTLYSVEGMKKMIVAPFSELACEDGDDGGEIEREFDEEFMPEFHSTIEKMQCVVQLWAKERIERIYAVST